MKIHNIFGDTVGRLAKSIGCLVALAFVCSPYIARSDWPQFRGSDARGISDGQGLPEKWSATENVEWKTDIAGRGWSSPIVAGDRVFLTTVINKGKSEKPIKGLYFGGDRPNPPDSMHQWQVICLDLKSGKLLWEKTVHEGKPDSAIHIKSSFASETPITDGKQLYCYFGNLGVYCFDFDGNEQWKKILPPNPTRFGWGTAASPVLHEGRLYLVNDNEQDSYLLSLDAKTGSELWRAKRDEKSNWATPFIWQNSIRTEIVTPGSGQVRSYDLQGNVLWSLTGMSSITIATPYEHNGLLYISSGYIMDLKKPLLAIKPGASGDISLAQGERSNEFIAWSQPKAAPYNPTSIIYEDRLYVLYDRSFLSCFKPATGEGFYESKRIPNGRAFTSSPWAYQGKVFCLNEDGVTFVVKSADELEILHTNTLAEDDMCMATPAIAGDRLLIRTAARVYCIREAKPAQSKPVSFQGIPNEKAAVTHQNATDVPKAGSPAPEGLGEHGYVDSGDVRIHYVTKGKGPLVVLIHGFPDFWYTWRKQMPALAEKYQVVAIDQRGYNLSGQPKGVANYAMPKLVDDVVAVVKHFQQQKATIVGHDWGGMVAWQFAMNYPELTERLVILNLPHPNGLQRELTNNPQQQKNSQYARFFQSSEAASQVKAESLADWVKDPAAKEAYRQAMLRSSMEGMLNYYKANYPREPYVAPASDGPKVKCSVLMIHGLKDKYLLADGLNDNWKWIEKDLTLVTVPDADHFVQQDAADFVTKTLANWLDR
jgi:pimeloyl-ACP methyl ester carboxylesterase/outer membrane protein assembly factor BamB